MCEKFKKWWAKNKSLVVTIFASFGAGIAAAFSLSRRNIGNSKQYIEQLERELDKYHGLNNELDKLNSELTTRLDELSESNSELGEQNRQLRELSASAEREIANTRADIATAKSSIRSGINTAEQLSVINRQIQEQSRKLRDGIAQLTDIAKERENKE